MDSTVGSSDKFAAGIGGGIPRLFASQKLMRALFALLALAYLYLFIDSLGGRWFSPRWTTDDGLQQLFPFHSVFDPLIFEADLIYEVMKGYLAPVHYWLSYAFTFFSGSPIMAGHWLHLLQFVLSSLFLFLAVRKVSNSTVGFFALFWFFHTRQVMQRLTGGLPRGWAAVVICGSLYLMACRKHKLTLLLLFIGCLTHPPTTFVCALAYGLFLIWCSFGEGDKSSRRALLALILLSPFYAYVTFSVVERPEHIGSMVTIEEAREMPEFQYPHGRFPFVPLRDVSDEIRMYAFQAFTGRFYSPSIGTRNSVRIAVLFLFSVLIVTCIWKRRSFVPPSWWAFFGAAWITYFASRLLAFKLYVPNRHLQFPLAIWTIAAFSVGFYLLAKELWKDRQGRKAPAARGALGLFVLLAVIFWGSGTGLYGDANFNYSVDKKGRVFEWIRANTPSDSLVAGHPTFIDGVLLFGKRRAFITTETYHPFYPGYALEARRRVALSLKAHYARSLRELSEIMLPEGVDFFVFERKRFYPEALAANDYQLPHKELAQQLGSRHYEDYAYRKIPRELNLKDAPYQVFRDAQSVVVDLRILQDFLKANELESVAPVSAEEPVDSQALEEQLLK